jgi:hypothetical protein
MPKNTQQPQPVYVKKVVRVKRKRSLVEFLITTICILSIFIVIGAFFSVGIWLHTFKVFTQETVVAELFVSKKIIKDGSPKFTVKYTPKKDVSGWWTIFGSDAKSADHEVSMELTGDQVFVEADYLRWSNWVTFANVKPVYKTNRVKTGFQHAEDYKKYNVEVVDLNGGPDWFAAKLQQTPDKFSWLAQSVYLSSAGINVTNEDVTYKVISTKDALVLERN